MILYIAAIAGVIVHVIVKFRDSLTKKEIFDWKRQLIFSALSIPTVLVMVYFKDVILSLHKITLLSDPEVKDIIQKLLEFLCFFVGYWCDSMWKNVEKTGRVSVKAEDQTINPN